jgi:hypothetical protein
LALLLSLAICRRLVSCLGCLAERGSIDVAELTLSVTKLACETVIREIPFLTSGDSLVIVSDNESDRGDFAGRGSVDVIVVSFTVTLLAHETVIRVGWSNAGGALAISGDGALCDECSEW